MLHDLFGQYLMKILACPYLPSVLHLGASIDLPGFSHVVDQISFFLLKQISPCIGNKRIGIFLIQKFHGNLGLLCLKLSETGVVTRIIQSLSMLLPDLEFGGASNVRRGWGLLAQWAAMRTIVQTWCLAFGHWLQLARVPVINSWTNVLVLPRLVGQAGGACLIKEPQRSDISPIWAKDLLPKDKWYFQIVFCTNIPASINMDETFNSSLVYLEALEPGLQLVCQNSDWQLDLISRKALTSLSPRTKIYWIYICWLRTHTPLILSSSFNVNIGWLSSALTMKRFGLDFR